MAEVKSVAVDVDVVDGRVASQAVDSTNAARSRWIRAGDLIIIFLSRDRTPVPLTVTPGQELVNGFGTFPHDDMVGRPFGAKLASRNKRGFVHLLRPTPELWTLALPHRTQILYTPDMSFIASHLGLSPGARLIEAGTGSGSFSHFATRCVARSHPESGGDGWSGRPTVGRSSTRNGGGGGKVTGDGQGNERADRSGESEEEVDKKEPVDEREAHILRQLSASPNAVVGPRQGRVWSFEFHVGRAMKAWEEFEHHRLFPTLSLRHRNVIKSGFGLEDAADAVFLDLPAPWDALHHAARAMRRDSASRICCFSPCVEQVLKTVAALRRGQGADLEDGQADEVRWTDIETYECLNRTHVSIWCGPNTPVPLTTIEEAIERIENVEERKGKRRAIQIERARQQRLQKLVDAGEHPSTEAEAEAKEESEKPLATEKAKEERQANDDEADPVVVVSCAESGQKRKRDDSKQTSLTANRDDGHTTDDEDAKAKPLLQRANVVSRPFPEMRGHTSYLTFATLVPRIVERSPDPTLEKEREAAKRKDANADRQRQRKEEARHAAAAAEKEKEDGAEE